MSVVSKRLPVKILNVYVPIKFFQQENNCEVTDMRSDDQVQLRSWVVQWDRIDKAVETCTFKRQIQLTRNNEICENYSNAE